MQPAVQSVQISQNEPNFCSRFEGLTNLRGAFRDSRRAASPSSTRIAIGGTRRWVSKAVKAKAVRTGDGHSHFDVATVLTTGSCKTNPIFVRGLSNLLFRYASFGTAKTAKFFATARDCADKGRSRRLTRVFAQAGIASCADGTELTSDKQGAAGHHRKKSKRIGPLRAIGTPYGSVALPFIQRRRGQS
jgi:hypothetical protein